MVYSVLVLVLILGTSLFSFYVSYLNYQYRNKPLSAVVSDVYETPKYEKWLRYFMTQFRFDTIKSIINTGIVILLLYAGFFRLLAHFSESVTSSQVLQTVVFIGIYFLMSFSLDLGFDYYFTFKIEEDFGFNQTTKKQFILDKIKNFLLTVILGGGILYLIASFYESLSWQFYLYTFLFLMAVIVFLNLFYVKLFVPMFNKLSPLKDGELKDEIMHFAEKEGIHLSKISVMNASLRSTKLNAYFSGFGKMKQIVLYDTLIQKMSVPQVVSVLAHEIGHAKHKHTISGMVQSSLILAFYMVVLFAVLHLQGFYTAFGIDHIFLGFGLILFMVLLSPMEFVLFYFGNRISRKHEYVADHFAATHYQKEALIDALKVLARANFSNLTPHPFYVKLHYSHPPIRERIEAILKIEE